MTRERVPGRPGADVGAEAVLRDRGSWVVSAMAMADATRYGLCGAWLRPDGAWGAICEVGGAPCDGVVCHVCGSGRGDVR